jgi:hypothetical protein
MSGRLQTQSPFGWSCRHKSKKDNSMQYMLILNETEEDVAKHMGGEGSEEYWGGWNAYIGAMAQAGIVVNGDGLEPPHTATTIRIRDGKRMIHDGPFADSKEQLAGYFIIEVPDLDTALEWAARAPAASTASVEVRPVMQAPPQAAA